MWNTYSPLLTEGPEKAALAVQRFREMSCNGGTLISTFVNPKEYDTSIKAFGLELPGFERPEMGSSPFREHNFPFYVMNMCRPLYWNWNPAKPIFKKWYETFERERDRKVFTRVPCVNNPEVKKAMDRYTGAVMEGLAPVRDLSLLYDLRDEPSITSFLLASDTCYCPHCMERMRAWLKDEYGDLAGLNAGWGTEFGSWDEVEPLTTQEALERREAGNWNFAPWHDHRTFNNDSFARVCREQGDLVRSLDPDATVGMTGTQCPWVYGGYDFAKLALVPDWVEPYDFAQSVDCLRSFKTRRDYPLLRTTGLGGNVTARKVMLWSIMFQAGGYSGTIIYECNKLVDVQKDDIPLNDMARHLTGVYAELRSGVPKLLQLTEELSSPVAVHYSQASINADFITSVAPRWRSVAASESHRFPGGQCREAWWKILEDRGLRPIFVSSTQVEAGKLLEGGVKVFILPRSIAISDAEAAEIRKFVEAGGVLLADGFAGRMDEHCRERETGVLDEFLGIRRQDTDGYHGSSQRASLNWDAEAGEPPRWGQGKLRAECSLVEERLEVLPGALILGCTEYSDSPLGITREHGKGRTVLMNCAPLEYLTARRTPSLGAGLQPFFGGALDRAGVEPEVAVLDAASGQPVPGWRVWGFAHGEARYYGLAPDLDVSQDVLGAIEVYGDADASRPVRLRFPLEGYIYEARSGRALGKASEVKENLVATEAMVYAVLPYEVKAVSLELSGGGAEAALETGGKAGEHVFRFDVIDAAGKRLLDLGANVVAAGGKAEWTPGCELPAGGRITCRDVATGVSAEVKI
jgi:hypothetical protein